MVIVNSYKGSHMVRGNPLLLLSYTLLCCKAVAVDQKMTPITISAKRIDRRPTSYQSQIFTAEDQEQSLDHSHLESIAKIPSISINGGSYRGSDAKIQIRGNRAEHTLVLFDDIPLNDPGMITETFVSGDWQNPWQTDLHILKGPQSVTHGPNALGGVIHFQTPEPNQLPKHRTSVEKTTQRSQTASHQQAFQIGSTCLLAGISGTDQSQQGIQNHITGNAYDIGFRSLSTGFHIRHKQFKSTWLFQEGRSPFDSRTPAQGGDSSQVTHRILGGIFYGNKEKGWHGGSHVQQTLRKDIGPYGGKNRGQLLGLQLGHTWSKARHQKLRLHGGVVFAKHNRPSVSIRQHRIFQAIEAIHPLTKKFIIEGGIRYDIIKGAKNSFNTSAGFSYLLKTGQLYSVAKTGFRPPSILQIYGGQFNRPNPNLKPESSIGLEGGYRYTQGQTQYNFAVFTQSTKNLIDWRNNQYINISRQQNWGIEVSASLPLQEDLTVGGGYTLLLAHAAPADKQPARMPKHKGLLNLEYTPSKTWAFVAEGIFQSATTDTAGGTHRLRGHFLGKLGATYKPTPQWDIFAKVENIANVRYETAYGFAGLPRFALFGATYKVMS